MRNFLVKLSLASLLGLTFFMLTFFYRNRTSEVAILLNEESVEDSYWIETFELSSIELVVVGTDVAEELVPLSESMDQ